MMERLQINSSIAVAWLGTAAGWWMQFFERAQAALSVLSLALACVASFYAICAQRRRALRDKAEDEARKAERIDKRG